MYPQVAPLPACPSLHQITQQYDHDLSEAYQKLTANPARAWSFPVYMEAFLFLQKFNSQGGGLQGLSEDRSRGLDVWPPIVQFPRLG